MRSNCEVEVEEVNCRGLHGCWLEAHCKTWGHQRLWWGWPIVFHLCLKSRCFYSLSHLACLHLRCRASKASWCWEKPLYPSHLWPGYPGSLFLWDGHWVQSCCYEALLPWSKKKHHRDRWNIYLYFDYRLLWYIVKCWDREQWRKFSLIWSRSCKVWLHLANSQDQITEVTGHGQQA